MSGTSSKAIFFYVPLRSPLSKSTFWLALLVPPGRVPQSCPTSCVHEVIGAWICAELSYLCEHDTPEVAGQLGGFGLLSSCCASNASQKLPSPSSHTVGDVGAYACVVPALAARAGRCCRALCPGEGSRSALSPWSSEHSPNVLSVQRHQAGVRC